jgi:methionyl-tRNA synthetase
MIKQYQDGLIGDIPAANHVIAQYEEALAACRFDKALDEVWEQIRGLNQYIEEEKPWTIAKAGDEEHLREVLAYQAGALIEIAELLAPFLPDTAEQIKAIFGKGVIQPTRGTLFPKQAKPDK